MTGRVLPFDTSAHWAADALLPFYVNATLRGDELAFVEKHVLTCEQCKNEVAWLRKIFANLAANPLFQDTVNAVPGPPQASENRDVPGNWGGRIQTQLRTAPPWTRWLLAAQFAAIAVLGTILATDTSDVASYRTLGATNASAHTQYAVAVMFDPGITESEIRRIVLGVGARIVDGPTSADVFVLEMPAERVDQALETLHTERAVRVAERLGPKAGH